LVKMKVLIIGCGEQGATIAKYLIEKVDVDEVRLAEKQPINISQRRLL